MALGKSIPTSITVVDTNMLIVLFKKFDILLKLFDKVDIINQIKFDKIN